MNTQRFSLAVLTWYDKYGRKNLPWQNPPNPYRAWVSEIMLQQTRVATVIPYFERFMAAFPQVSSLADAPLDDVLSQWSGLGYYARARNLHNAAQVIRDEHRGEVPCDFDALIDLPGIGRSTAGAIASLACGQRHAILDGNVKRVLTRHAGIEGWSGKSDVAASLWELAERFTPHERVADYTQAIMDLGATLCTRRSPDCDRCPVAVDCVARLQRRQHELPASRPRKALPVRETMMIMLTDNACNVLLERRPPQGVWGGLLSFPEARDEDECRDWCESMFRVRAAELHRWPELVHTFTHFRLRITPIRIEAEVADQQVMEGDRWVWYNPSSPRGGLPKPVKQLLGELALTSTGERV